MPNTALRFTTSPIDHRRLHLCAHQIGRQHPGRREHVHGRVTSDLDRRNTVPAWAWWMTLAVLAPFIAPYLGGY